eukprot:1913761-Ditylum_brightwellii.AAC.1
MQQVVKNNRSCVWIWRHSKLTTVPKNVSKETNKNSEKSTAASSASASKTIPQKQKGGKDKKQKGGKDKKQI